MVRPLRRSKPVIDNDLPVIAEKYREFRAKYPVPGTAPAQRRGGGRVKIADPSNPVMSAWFRTRGSGLMPRHMSRVR